MKADTEILPRGLLCERDAALWLGGVSVAHLRDAGIPRRVWGRRRLYDVRDLAAFRDGLPYETEGTAEDVASCDAAFG
jgi:hypothetical protein